jgi:hypothetical protein
VGAAAAELVHCPTVPRMPPSQPSPAPSPEPVDVWTRKPFCTVVLHEKEHEVSLAYNEQDVLVVGVFNTNSGDRFEQVLGRDTITQLLPQEIPAGVRSPQGFAEFVRLALEREAGATNTEVAQITCESRENRDHFVADISLTTGSGMFAARYPVTLQVPLKNRANAGDKHLIALRTLSEKFSGQVEEQEHKFMDEIAEVQSALTVDIAALQSQVDLMRLQLNQRVFFGVNHSVHIQCESLTMASKQRDLGKGNDVSNRPTVSCPNKDLTEKAFFATDTTFLMPLPSRLLEPLQLCRDLKTFIVSSEHGHNITDVDFVRGLPKLEHLELRKPKIKDFAQLATLPRLKTLIVSELAIYGGGEIDVTPLATLTTLESIDFNNSPAVANVASLAVLASLKTLNVTETRVTDRRAFAGCDGLRVIPE